MSHLSSPVGQKVGFNSRLVRTVQKYPIVYNYELQEYPSRVHKQRAWKMIATEMGASVAQCKEKWRNLRICYTEYLRKYTNDTPEQLICRSYLTDVMKFLRPFIRTRENYTRTVSFEADTSDATSNFPPNAICPKLEDFEDAEIISDDDETCDVELMAPKYSENIVKEEVNISPPPPSPEEIQNLKESVQLPDVVPIKDNHTENKSIHEYTGATVLLNSNPRHQFLMSILPDLEKMDDRQMRKFRSRVSTAIEEILEDE